MTDHDHCDMTWPPGEDERADGLELLADVLAEIEAHDTDYDVRYFLVLFAVGTASSAGLDAGFRIDPAEPDWPVAYIKLPTGQVSWRMPAFADAYDGHTTEEKYARVRAFIEQEAAK